MQYIEAVSTEVPVYQKKLFLAGGITDCPDWQAQVVSELDLERRALTIFNPRRKSFNTSYEKESIDQIHWEYYTLREATHILFWFPCETLCPITLFEYGSALERNCTLFVGAHPDYKRLSDIQIQTALRRTDIQIKTSLEELIKEVKWKI